MEDPDEIYDDAASVQQPTVSTGLSALKSKFESQANSALPIKPTVTPKPKVAPKWGGGGTLNVCAAPAKIADGDKPKPGFTKPGNIASNEKENIIMREKSPNVATVNGFPRRDSKLNIPDAFKQNTTPPVAEKPKPKWKTNDTNNNAKITEPPTTNKFKPVPIMAKQNESMTSSPTGNTSPRGNPPSSVKIPVAAMTGKAPPKGANVVAMAGMLGGLSPADLKANLKHVSQSKEEQSPTRTTTNAKFPWKPPNTETSNNVPGGVEFRNAFNKFGPRVSGKRKSIKSVIRKKDGKRFHKAEDSCFKDSGDAPAKPDKLDFEIDLEDLIQEYKTAIISLGGNPNESGIEESEELYDDCANTRPDSSRVSMIEPMTEEEELEQWKNAGFTGIVEENGFPPPPTQDVEYDDTALPDGIPAENPDELYEPLDDILEDPPAPGPKPSNESSQEPPPLVPKLPPHVDKTDTIQDGPAEPAETPKPKETKEAKKERERKEREEKELQKKKEKELQKKEEELKQLMKTFKIDAEGLAYSLCKGSIKATAKPKDKKKDLAVTEGDRVDVIRMNDNPKFKWLVRLDTTDKVGYVDASNIEVMEGSVANHPHTTPRAPPPVEEQETYEAVDGEDTEKLDEDEIYEEVT